MMNLFLTRAFGLVMIAGGIFHFISPDLYKPFIPPFLPTAIINFGTGVLEIGIGIGTFIPRFRSMSCLGILVLMIAFLPLHLADVFKENPAIGSHEAALVRLPLQFILIFWAFHIYRKSKAG